MNQTQKLIEQAGFSSTFETDRLDKLIELTIAHCITAIRNSPPEHCRTTFDYDQWSSTIDQCVRTIQQQFKQG